MRLFLWEYGSKFLIARVGRKRLKRQNFNDAASFYPAMIKILLRQGRAFHSVNTRSVAHTFFSMP